MLESKTLMISSVLNVREQAEEEEISLQFSRAEQLNPIKMDQPREQGQGQGQATLPLLASTKSLFALL